MRQAEIARETAETDIWLRLNLDGRGDSQIHTGIGFLDHMLHLMCKHGFLDIELRCTGDLDVDNHHTVEDIGICIGQALKAAVGEKKGMTRYSTIFTPMDEALTIISLDFSGRSYLYFGVDFKREYVGKLETELIQEFFRALVNHSGITLHIDLQRGENVHHIVESIFKGFGRAIDQATFIQDRIKGTLSTKGSL
jgi:imidazoleglycerol-phosphate dehydratase